jgi:hypothetical protein
MECREMNERTARQGRRRLNIAARQYVKRAAIADTSQPAPVQLTTIRRTIAIAKFYGPAVLFYTALLAIAGYGIWDCVK